jgi:molybdate transport system substrate-binding protein
MMSRLLLALLIATTTSFAHGAPLRVAVADNFQATFEKLAAAYTKQSAEQVEGSYATTDELYKRISDGVPYAALFAADGDKTAQLVADGRAKATSRFVYAIGRLALWTPAPGAPPPSEWLADPQHRIAIADPQTTLYGLAAKETLTSMKLWDRAQSRLAIAPSAEQAMQSVENGTVPGGFVAQSQLVAHYKGTPPAAEAWLVPLNMHAPIVQEAVVLNTPDAERAQAFMRFVGSDAGRAIIESGGYMVLLPAPH